MRFTGALLILLATCGCSAALGLTGHHLPAVASALTGLLVLLCWLRLTEV